jgi:site-specific recombinase XerC
MLELSTVDVHVTTHQLPDWFGTETYGLSKDIRLTQELLGHESVARTALYTQWSRQDAHAVVARLHLETATSSAC